MSVSSSSNLLRNMRLALAAGLAALSIPASAEVARPAALVADGVPRVPNALADASRPLYGIPQRGLRRLERGRPLDADLHPLPQHQPAALGFDAARNARPDQLRARAQDYLFWTTLMFWQKHLLVQ